MAEKRGLPDISPAPEKPDMAAPFRACLDIANQVAFVE